MICKIAIAALCASMASAAFAGDLPLYQSAPSWVSETPYHNNDATSGDRPTFEIFDDQQRIADGQLWHYNDTAVRLSSPEMLSQFATITLPWAPDKGDIIFHEVSIQRGAEKIDLLAARKFDVLRREQNLERLELTGFLTATMPIAGLRVGDVLRVRFSVTSKDAALGGNVETVAPLLAAPLRIGTGRLRVLWPAKSQPKWQFLAAGVAAKPVRKGDEMELLAPLPAAKQPEVPDDAPGRYRRPPLFELSTFGEWAAVSRAMAPLYATDGLIANGSALAEEVARIKAAESTPLNRAQMALRLVQDQVRYFAVMMDGGNYVPQKPADTWRLRYGDCKAKTLLLLALLHAMDIEAEPVAANLGLGNLVAERVPSIAAFNHVFVRARVDGKTYWLDGTGAGSRIADIEDTPAVGSVLPLLATGAGLTTIATHRNARPMLDLSVEADETTSIDLPSVLDVTAVLRGQAASAVLLGAANMDSSKQHEAIDGFFNQMIGEGQFVDGSIKSDADAGTVIVKAKGVIASSWRLDDRQIKRQLGKALSNFSFDPNRAKTEWAQIPVATMDPRGFRYRLKLRLPGGGAGFTIDGVPDTNEKFAGSEFSRSLSIKNEVLDFEERLDSTGAEIAAADIPRERDRVATAKTREPRLIAPASAKRRWDLGDAEAGGTQLAGAMTIYGRSIQLFPDRVESYFNRASLASGTGNARAALADFTKALSIAPDVRTYMMRATTHRALGNLPAALADAQKAKELDPSSTEANTLLADIQAERGDLTGAIASLDERIAVGGEAGDAYRQAKAGLIGDYGDPKEALGIIEQMMARKPGSPSLLNASCWIKGTRGVLLETALKDCTNAIELSTSSVAALDSRSVVWFRLGKYEEALADLNAVLAQAPGMAPSRYMRSLVLAKLKRPQESDEDLRIARRIDPRVGVNYERWGLTR